MIIAKVGGASGTKGAQGAKNRRPIDTIDFDPVGMITSMILG